MTLPPRILRARAVGAIAVAVTLGLVTLADASPRTDRVAPKEASGSSNTTIPLSHQTARLTKIAVVEQPLAAVQRPGDDAIYVVSKTGRISAIRSGTVDPAAVLDISARIDATNERGLLGLAFPPNRRDVLYVDYTTKVGNVIVSEIPFDGRVADLSRERVLLDMPKPFNEHNAGTLLFDADAMLYVAIGDGGGSGDKFNNGQRTDTLLGKVLRIDPKPTNGLPYGIPADNPFVPKPGVPTPTRQQRQEIVAYGLRNPWRISIDPDTKDLWIPDVGQNLVEEINRMPKSAWGTNFGWRLREGDRAFNGQRPRGAVDPVYAYPHLDGRCAVAGGFLYRGKALVGLVGTYVFGDVCSGHLMALRNTSGKWAAEELNVTIPYLTAFGVLDSGELVVLSLEGGVYRLEAA